MSATLASPTTQTGKFVWRDLMSTDPERSKAFFTGLFGWTVKPMPMGDFTYEMLGNEGREFGGVVPLDPNHGMPSHWISYVHVPSVDEAADLATRAGGTVHVPPTDIPGVGRFAVVADPQGAFFSPFTDGMSPDEWPEEPAVSPPGSACWNELITADPDDAMRFYGDVIGWQFEDSGMGMPYTILKQGDVMHGGLMQKPDEVPVSAWLIYFQVSDLDKALADVDRLGGKHFGEIIEVPTIGRISWAQDPTGATFAFLEPAM